MFTWLAKQYSRKLVNINVNIVLAGVLALPIVLGILWLAGKAGITEAHPWWVSTITFVADVVADVLIYFGLHWLANHSKWQKAKLEDVARAADHIGFLKDATIVQMERGVLSPLLYVLWLGTQNFMLHNGYSLNVATITGFLIGISTSRSLHTAWMIMKERKRVARLAGLAAMAPTAAAAPAGPSMPAQAAANGVERIAPATPPAAGAGRVN